MATSPASLTRIRRAAVPSGRGHAREAFTGRATEIAELLRLQADMRGVDASTLSPVAAIRALRVRDALVSAGRPRSIGGDVTQQARYIGASLLRREYTGWNDAAAVFGDADTPQGRETTQLLIDAAREAVLLDEVILSFFALCDRYVPLLTICSTLRDIIEQEAK